MTKVNVSLSGISWTITVATFTFISTPSWSDVQFRISNQQVVVGESVDIVIHVEQPMGLGAFQFTVAAIPNGIEWQQARLSNDANGMLEFQVQSAGAIRVKAVLGEALSRDGPVVIVSAKVVGSSPVGNSPQTESKRDQFEVALRELRAWSYEPILELPTESHTGNLTSSSSEARVLSNNLIYKVALAVFAVMALVFGLRLLRSPRPG